MNPESLLDEFRDARAATRDAGRRIRWRNAIDEARRGLPTEQIKYSEEMVADMTKKLKSKGTVTADDLSALMYALAENENHISAFFQVIGGLQGLIRELTGINATKQLFAIGCLCNLSLGPPKSCLAIAKASGAYMITYLQNCNSNFVELCAWTLGNLYASDEKVALLLKDQGLFDHLIRLIDNKNEPKVIDAAAYALGHILFSKWCYLEDCHTEELSRNVMSLTHKSEQVYWVVYLLSDKECAQKIFLSNALLKFTMNELINIGLSFNPVVVSSLIRIIANLWGKVDFNKSDVFEIINSDNFIAAMNTLLNGNNKDIKKDVYWLLGNIFTSFQSSADVMPLFQKLAKTLNMLSNL